MKKILNIFLVGILVTGLSSCLKDKTMIGPDSPGAIKNVIEFANIGEIKSNVSSIYPVYAQSYPVTAPGKLTVTVNYAGVDNAPSDINVVVALDPSILTTYNAKNVKDARAQAIELGQDPDEAEAEVDQIAPLKPDSYTLGNLNLVIPKGQRTASFDVALKPNLFTFDQTYALPFKISSSSLGVVSGNFGNIIVKISGRNRLDGVYNLKTSAATSLRPGLNENGAKLATSGANSVSYPLLNYYTGNIVTVSVDPVTNVATVTDSSLGVPAIMDPASKYDPATKVLYLKWKAGSRSFEETYTYTGPRP
ncbi:DUF1735 domain-containing protein [Pedobacter gandavensis]|uniref:DUF1735 domain-containing protein n=1 Tax=Pedobacter gandavensis TaxID=2679963 RepID=A0ABR6EZ25_9SPHI|nr:DUF1735 domain-containing protein [Pedobacter gandavensis]MBB2150089.1 DUF1735 domain-containing protein [Pedobacter gandavensis]